MIITYLLITLIAMFGHLEDFLGTSLINRPLVLGPLVGIVLGDMTQGIIIGATLELIFMGNIKVGAAIPPDVISGGVLGTAFAIMSGKGPEIALAIAVPVSILAEMVISSLFVLRPMFNSRFSRYAEEGDYRKIEWLHIGSGLLKPIMMGLIIFLSLQLGAGVIKSFLDSIPPWVQSGLQVAGNMLPAVGFALLMNLMFNSKVAAYFFLGFILASYLKLPMIAIGGLGVIAALIITGTQQKNVALDDMGFDDMPAEAENTLNSLISKNDLRKVFLRSLALEANFNFETWQNTGFAFSIMPVLRKLYTTRTTMARALKRHLAFFNTAPHGSTLILGIVAAMEEQSCQQEDFDKESINGVKLGLMGPLAGVFDSFFWGTLKVIAAGVGVSLALKGSILGPLLFLLIFNIPHFLLRYYLTFIGYSAGNKFLQNLAKSNIMDKLTKGASILGLMVVGAMPAMLMPIKTPLNIGSADSQVAVQSILDQLVPNMLPLILTFLVFYFVKRNVKTNWLLLGILALGFIGSILHLIS